VPSMQKSNPRKLAREWIEGLPSGRQFSNEEMYAYLMRHHADACNARGDAEHEPRYRNDARWAIQGAKRDNIVRDVAIGMHERLAPRA
jgi:hypothetical protein